MASRAHPPTQAVNTRRSAVVSSESQLRVFLCLAISTLFMGFGVTPSRSRFSKDVCCLRPRHFHEPAHGFGGNRGRQLVLPFELAIGHAIAFVFQLRDDAAAALIDR